MLNTEQITQRYRDNYQMACEEGHQDEAERIAWDWTEQEMMRQFWRFKEQCQAAKQEAINKAHFG